MDFLATNEYYNVMGGLRFASSLYVLSSDDFGQPFLDRIELFCYLHYIGDTQALGHRNQLGAHVGRRMYRQQQYRLPPRYQRRWSSLQFGAHLPRRVYRQQQHRLPAWYRVINISQVDQQRRRNSLQRFSSDFHVHDIQSNNRSGAAQYLISGRRVEILGGTSTSSPNQPDHIDEPNFEDSLLDSGIDELDREDGEITSEDAEDGEYVAPSSGAARAASKKQKDSPDKCVDCSICLESIHNQDNPSSTATQLPCRHLFHRDCIAVWLSVSNTCPMCRRQLEEEEKSSESFVCVLGKATLSPQGCQNVHSATLSPSPPIFGAGSIFASVVLHIVKFYLLQGLHYIGNGQSILDKMIQSSSLLRASEVLRLGTSKNIRSFGTKVSVVETPLQSRNMPID
ncbi:hypothetical protein KP509_32G068600 [Ceratopteris richardii]|uniref:RING-type domain-containing protein n=1 Tax=Ceratopteris richardii TaxID=49495 RepID=A0A8T2QVX0_CERRI|nr:hypothetical protein KP509_32G068600 [Ceratopteris richardii]